MYDSRMISRAVAAVAAVAAAVFLVLCYVPNGRLHNATCFYP
jgi:hypothetical protein